MNDRQDNRQHMTDEQEQYEEAFKAQPQTACPWAISADAAALFAALSALAQPQTASPWEISGDEAALFDALSAFQGDIHGVTKSQDNPFFKSKYADLAACWDVIRQPLAKHGLAVVQMPVGDDGTLHTILTHKSGAYLTFGHKMVPVKNDPQGQGSSITYNRRYCLAAVLGLAQQDDDANAASGAPQPSGLTDQQVNYIETALNEAGLSADPILTYFKVENLAQIPPAKFSTVLKQIKTKGKPKKTAEEAA